MATNTVFEADDETVRIFRNGGGRLAIAAYGAENDGPDMVLSNVVVIEWEDVPAFIKAVKRVYGEG